VPESLKEDGRPAQQWYWDDWFSEFGLRLCSLAARGLWVDMLGIMFKAEIRGTLIVNGRRINGKALAKILGELEQIINKLLKELEDNEVFSRLEDSTIICRRMFKESKRKEDISRIRSEAGKKGAKSKWQKMAKMAAPTSSPTSSSTSSSSSTSKHIYTQKELNSLFDKWFKRYPRTDDPGKARQKWIAIVKKGIHPQTLEDRLTGYIVKLNREGTEKTFVIYAKTFLYPGKEKEKIPPRWEEFALTRLNPNCPNCRYSLTINLNPSKFISEHFPYKCPQCKKEISEDEAFRKPKRL